MGVTLWKAKSPIAVTAMLLVEIKQFGVTINHLQNRIIISIIPTPRQLCIFSWHSRITWL